MPRFIPGRLRPLVAAVALLASSLAAAESHVCVTNEMGDDVSVIDIASAKVVATSRTRSGNACSAA